FKEEERVAPKVRLTVHDRGVEPAAHGRRTGDRVSARRLRDVDLDMDHRLGAVTRRRNAGVFVERFARLPYGLWRSRRRNGENTAHERCLSTETTKREPSACIATDALGVQVPIVHLAEGRTSSLYRQTRQTRV